MHLIKNWGQLANIHRHLFLMMPMTEVSSTRPTDDFSIYILAACLNKRIFYPSLISFVKLRMYRRLNVSSICKSHNQFISTSIFFFFLFYVVSMVARWCRWWCAQWSKLSSTSQQLDCMQRHAEGYGDLWNKQTTYGNDTTATMATKIDIGGTSSMDEPRSSNTGTSMACDKKKASITIKSKPNDWVVIPVFGDIVRLAITAREDCLKK